MLNMFKELKRYKLPVVFILLSVIGGVMSSLALPALLSSIINEAIPNSDIGLIISMGGIMLIFVLVGGISNIITGFFASRVSMGVGKSLRSQVFKKVQFFSQTEIDNFSTSSLITRTNNDIIQVQNFINMVLRISLMAPFMAVGGIKP